MNSSKGLSSKEENAIEELTARMKGLLTPKLSDDPSLYYRFLKARDFDVDKAEKMLLKHITWRKTYQVDNILDDFKPREYFYKYVLPTTIGYDKDGDRIEYAASGNIVTADVLKCSTFNEYARYWIWYGERVTSPNGGSEKAGKACFRFTGILDFANLTLSNTIDKSTTEIYLFLICLLQENFPERMKAIYAINAPSYYVFLFSILKAIMASSTLNKIHFYGQDGWKEKLLNVVDADVLPAFLGGNRTDPDGNPLCLTFVNHCDKIPPEYYLSDQDRYFEDVSKIKTTAVPCGERKEISLYVAEIGSIIKWKYFVKKKDIGFGLSFQESEEDTKQEIIPTSKYSTPDGTETGFYRSHSTGKYIIIFDNSHSWFITKEIEYILEVIKPE